MIVLKWLVDILIGCMTCLLFVNDKRYNQLFFSMFALVTLIEFSQAIIMFS